MENQNWNPIDVVIAESKEYISEGPQISRDKMIIVHMEVC